MICFIKLYVRSVSVFFSVAPQRLDDDGDDDDEGRPLAESLLLAIADLLFCPDFTIQSRKRSPVSPPSGNTSDVEKHQIKWSKKMKQVYLLLKRINNSGFTFNFIQ